MVLRVNNIKLPLDARPEEIRASALKKVRKREEELLSFRIVRQSVDARKKQVQFVYSVELCFEGNVAFTDDADVRLVDTQEPETPLKSNLKSRPVVVGTGPCGLFCALTLAEAGSPPFILERGAVIEKRAQRIDAYWQGDALDPNSNVQFGEGGAGTFSDGKLTTRINDRRATRVLEVFHRFGAEADILFKAKPHIGTDVLRRVIENLRKHLICLGCEFQFETALTDICLSEGQLKAITTSRGETIPCRHLVLAIGHSARDTYEMLYERGVSMIQKPFSVGVRIEHLQKELDQALYGDFAGHPKLGPAEYQVSHRVGEDACYSFCMCPGGVVVAAASEAETIVTNGMSYHARNGENANAALCMNVDRRYFDSNHPLAGVTFQRTLEQQAFRLHRGKAPIQTVGNFLKKGNANREGRISPSYTGQVQFSDFHNLFPEPVTALLEVGLLQFEKQIHGFAAPDALLTGPETRTSAPVRILRDSGLQSISTRGIYPAGEGAGYAGGIVSAAVDGIRVAEAMITGDVHES